MKKIVFILGLCFTWLLSQAQFPQSDSWKISWNKKVIAETNKKTEAAGIGKIKTADLKKNYSLEIVYKEADIQKEKEWIRSFMIVDESDKELARKDSIRTWKITSAQLKKLFGNKKKIILYTIAIPSDPDLAARVRVRRVQLCTLELK